MEQSADEKELTSKLVTAWHLNVPERKSLPDRRAKASLILAAIEEELRSHGRFPSQWQPEDSFDGGLIELKPDGTCRISWNAEVSMLRYETVAIEECDCHRTAAETFARKFFGGDIDGIPIDWER